MLQSCEVCGYTPALPAVGSLIDGSRHAYCLACLKAEAEPYPLLVQALASPDGRDGERARRAIAPTLRALGKRLAELEADLASLRRPRKGTT